MSSYHLILLGVQWNFCLPESPPLLPHILPALLGTVPGDWNHCHDYFSHHWLLSSSLIYSGTLCRIRLTLKPFAHFPRCYPQPCSRGSTTSSASWSSSSAVPGPPREDHMPVLPVWLSAGTCGRCRFVKQNQHFNLNQYILYIPDR